MDLLGLHVALPQVLLGLCEGPSRDKPVAVGGKLESLAWTRSGRGATGREGSPGRSPRCT